VHLRGLGFLAMNQDRLIELHSKYAEADEVQHENNKEYQEYLLELIINPESRSVINRLEMEWSYQAMPRMGSGSAHAVKFAKGKLKEVNSYQTYVS
jgi:hypothetical protein